MRVGRHVWRRPRSERTRQARWPARAVAGLVVAGLATGGVAVAAPGDPSATLVADDAVPGTPCSTAAEACVDLGTHTAWLIRDGKVIRGPVPFADGDVEDPTPRGSFRVEWKAEQWTSREYLTPMPWSVFFAPGGIAFHEGSQETASAGCVKLGPEEAHAWFDYLQVGDDVEVR
ncbi:L,D-transpeptidase-like protein [Pseudonocardia kunmingensis]|uniref:L,D-transpeptidase-like protein n=1 Tax=Pseudonocardia kunmingensis TaxID=630975 RepID=A0A543DKQ0_9PSEU|nr:L,D-transpeptidase-like protein [Pseudonocardia kunmingensis]